MSVYAKVTGVITLLVVAITATSLWFTATVSTGVVQASLDARAKDAASFVALALNDVDLDRDLDLVEYIINGAFEMDGIEQITLVDEMERVKIERKKAQANVTYLYSDWIVLSNQEAMAVITRNQQPSGKIILKSDTTQAYVLLDTKMQELLKLFIIIGLASIVLFAVTLKLFLQPSKN